MVGDSKTDILAAHSADIPVIAVNFGYTDAPVETFFCQLKSSAIMMS